MVDERVSASPIALESLLGRPIVTASSRDDWDAFSSDDQMPPLNFGNESATSFSPTLLTTAHRSDSSVESHDHSTGASSEEDRPHSHGIGHQPSTPCSPHAGYSHAATVGTVPATATDGSSSGVGNQVNVAVGNHTGPSPEDESPLSRAAYGPRVETAENHAPEEAQSVPKQVQNSCYLPNATVQQNDREPSAIEEPPHTRASACRHVAKEAGRVGSIHGASQEPSRPMTVPQLPLVFVPDPPSLIPKGQEVSYRELLRGIIAKTKKQQLADADATPGITDGEHAKQTKTPQPLGAQGPTEIYGRHTNGRSATQMQSAVTAPSQRTCHLIVPAGPDFRNFSPEAVAYSPLCQEIKLPDVEREARMGVDRANLTNSDRILGRGHVGNEHIGNVYWRVLVTVSCLYYYGRNTKKRDIASNIVAKVRHDGGRFLKQEADGLYYEIGNEEAIKITQKKLAETRADYVKGLKRSLADEVQASEPLGEGAPVSPDGRSDGNIKQNDSKRLKAALNTQRIIQ